MLETIFSSNSPVDCYIVKGRLQTEGIDCFIFDENIIWVHPFYAVAVGGVKLKVTASQSEQALKIMEALNHGLLLDGNGEYDLHSIFGNEIIHQDEILRIKSQVRNFPDLLNNPGGIKYDVLSSDELNIILEKEKTFLFYSEKKFSFSWEQFWGHLFDPGLSVFNYLHVRPVEYYIEKDLTDHFNKPFENENEVHCPNCHSKNTAYGVAIDYGWDPLYLILPFIIWFLFIFTAPFPLFRKKFHCFNCGYNFRRQKSYQ